MSCDVDSYYSTPFPASDYCGYIGQYCNCRTGTGGCLAVAGQPDCCPENTTWTGGYNTCGASNGGRKWLCTHNEPSMDDEARANCCTNMIPSNINNGNPQGYCRSGWCPNNDKCKSWMTGYCVGSNLSDPRCIKFCKSNLGACDAALKSYCKDEANFGKSVCGCAMPFDQYPLSRFTTPNAPSIPVKCNKECALDPDAVPLLDQPDCNIGTICVINIKDFEVAKDASVGGINIEQNCGNSPNTNGSSIFKKYWYVFLIIFIVIIVLIILLVIFVK